MRGRKGRREGKWGRVGEGVKGREGRREGGDRDGEGERSLLSLLAFSFLSSLGFQTME